MSGLIPPMVGNTVRKRSTIALFGDSMSFNNGPTVNTPGSTAGDFGYFNWANFTLGGRLELTANLGVSGNDTGQMLARLATAVADSAGIVVVEGGTNDLLHGLSAAQTQANLTLIYQALVACGKTVVAMTVIPRPTSGTGAITAGQKAQLLTTNRFIKKWCREHDGMVLCDPFPYMMDLNGEPATNMLMAADGLHPNRLGAMVWGRVLAACLAPLIPGSLHLFSGRGQGDPYNHLDFSVFDGTTGGTATPGTGTIAGSVAQGWTLQIESGTGTVTASLVARVDGLPGYWQQLVISGGNVALEFFRNSRSEGLTGQQAVARMEIDASVADWANATVMSLQCKDNGNNNYGEIMTAAGDLPMTNPGYGILETVPVTPTADGTSQLCRARFQADAGTIRLGMSAIRYPAEA